MKRLDTGIILAQERSSSGIGAEGDAILQLQIRDHIIEPPQFVEQAILGKLDGLGDRLNHG
jgi:hypothetical protein